MYDALPWSGGCAPTVAAVAMMPLRCQPTQDELGRCGSSAVGSALLVYCLFWSSRGCIGSRRMKCGWVANLCVVVVVDVVFGLPPLCCAPPAVGFSITLKGISKIISSVGKFKIEKYPRNIIIRYYGDSLGVRKKKL